MAEINWTKFSYFQDCLYATENMTSIRGPLQSVDVMMLLSTIIASVGIGANFTVIIFFLNDQKLRKKIPNIFIINQVGILFTHFTISCTNCSFTRNVNITVFVTNTLIHTMEFSLNCVT